MLIPRAKYYIHMIINSPRGETEYTVKMNNLNKAMTAALKHHPSATSVVMSIVPNKDSMVTLD